jgi:Ni/Co efflux regulator RcnB
MLAMALALSMTAGAASAQLLVPQGGDQRGGPPRQEQQRPADRVPDRGPDRGPNRGPDRGPPERLEGPRAYDSRGHNRNTQQDWRRGDRVDREDWRRGGRIDYRERNLRQPPRGYEWREVNGAAVLGAIATGVIADILLNGRR